MSRCTRHRDAYPRRIDKLYEGTALGSVGFSLRHKLLGAVR